MQPFKAGTLAGGGPGHAGGTHRPRARIREARQQSDNPQAFIAALAEHGIGLAQASRADAVQSEFESTEAQITGGWKPTFREGEIVAVSARGDVYRLTPRTTGDQDIQKFLAGFKVQAEFRQAGGEPLLLSIEEMQGQRRQHQQELEAFKAHTEPELGKTAGNIRLAYNLTDSPLAFKEYVEQDGLTAARVGWQDIRQRENARKQENRDAVIRRLERRQAGIYRRRAQAPGARTGSCENTITPPVRSCTRRRCCHSRQVGKHL